MSLTIYSLVSLVIGRLLQNAGITTTDQEISTFLGVTMQIVGALGVWYGRYRRGDITWYGKKI